MFASDDLELMQTLEMAARARHDGHLTVLRFTTGCRVGFRTPNSREDIAALSFGRTFAEAARAALAAEASVRSVQWTG
jgi:hypothetical protein